MGESKRTCDIDLGMVRRWAVEAGELALARFHHVEPWLKAGGELVTLADGEVESFLVQRLQSAYPGHQIIGEESGSHTGEQECLWAIDPIDGTRAFISGLPVWGVSIGILERGRLTRGVFHMPALHEIYHVDAEGDACWGDVRLPELAPQEWDANSLLCVPSDAHRAYDISFQGVTRAMGSTAANIIYVARGSALGALVGRVAIWDIAAALAILERVGGAVVYLSGAPVDLGDLLDGRKTPEPMVAAAPGDLERLLSQIHLHRSP